MNLPTEATIFGKRVFTEAQLQKMREELPGIVRELEAAQENQKAEAARLKAKVKDFEALILEVSTWITTGSAMMNIECDIEYDISTRIKRYIDRETGKTVETRSMTIEEYQSATQRSLFDNE